MSIIQNVVTLSEKKILQTNDSPLNALDIKLSKYKARCHLMKRNLTVAKDLIQLFDGDHWVSKNSNFILNDVGPFEFSNTFHAHF